MFTTPVSGATVSHECAAVRCRTATPSVVRLQIQALVAGRALMIPVLPSSALFGIMVGDVVAGVAGTFTLAGIIAPFAHRIMLARFAPRITESTAAMIMGTM